MIPFQCGSREECMEACRYCIVSFVQYRSDQLQSKLHVAHSVSLALPWFPGQHGARGRLVGHYGLNQVPHFSNSFEVRHVLVGVALPVILRVDLVDVRLHQSQARSDHIHQPLLVLHHSQLLVVNGHQAIRLQEDLFESIPAPL